MLKISIVTPCFNSEKYIADTIQSVISQRGGFVSEYVIVDGGSTDSTLEIIGMFKRLINSGFSKLLGSNVSFTSISEKDNGMYDALAKGLKSLTGDIVAYINSDDYYQPGAFSTVTEIFERYPEVEWLTGMHLFYSEKGSIVRSWLPFKYDRDWIRKGMYGTILPFVEQEATFWRRKLLDFIDFERLKGYKLAGDFYLWYTFSQHADLYIVNSCLGGFRISSHQLSKQLDRYYEEFLSIADPTTRLDKMVGWCVARLGELLTDEWKMLLNNHIIRFHNGQWWKPDTARRERLKSFIPRGPLRDLFSRLIR